MFFKHTFIALSLLFTAAIAEENYYVEAGNIVGIEPWLLWGIADTESGHNPYAINHNKNGTYDIGVMQVNSIHFKRFGLTAQDLLDPKVNILTGAIILKECFDKHGNNWMAVNCYNGLSPENRKYYVYANKVYKHMMKGREKYAAR